MPRVFAGAAGGVVNSEEQRAQVRVEAFSGSRGELMALFAEADDSATEIARYLNAGEVFVARGTERVFGHVQLIEAGTEWEIRSLAVIASERGKGVGAALVRAAVERARRGGAARVVVATATADIGNLRFYQRLGFRMDRVERDAFSPERGYAAIESDGIPVRDRVWFSIEFRDACAC